EVMHYYHLHARLYNLYFIAAHDPSQDINLYRKGTFELDDLNLMIHKNSLYTLFPSVNNNFQSDLITAKSRYSVTEKEYIEVSLSEFQKIKLETAAIEEKIQDPFTYNKAIQYYALQ